MLCVLPIALAGQASFAGPQAEAPWSAPEKPSGETNSCPSPVLPESALALGQYANLELTLTANRDGSLQKVIISKQSRARLYDEYTRSWVEKHWKMPPAKPDDPEVRKFIAPIVYPKKELPPGGRFPPPNYPAALMRQHIQGLVIIEILVAPSGEVESTRTIVSSGHKDLDAHSEQWVHKHWKFPAGEKCTVYWPVVYKIQ